jgi:hypothetical protein
MEPSTHLATNARVPHGGRRSRHAYESRAVSHDLIDRPRSINVMSPAVTGADSVPGFRSQYFSAIDSR